MFSSPGYLSSLTLPLLETGCGVLLPLHYCSDLDFKQITISMLNVARLVLMFLSKQLKNCLVLVWHFHP